MSAAPPARLRAEHLDTALGIGEARPRLSWWLPAGARSQTGYQVEVDGVVHTVVSGENVLVPWPAEPLTSGRRCVVRVRVTTDLGTSGWSEPLAVEAGLLEPSDWQAGWVLPTADPGPVGRRPAYLLRGGFTVDRPVRRARLYATAHGVFEPWLDGERVGDEELLPGYTEYSARTQVRTWDVTDRLGPGEHVLGALLADGWYRGQVGLLRASDQWGTRTALLAQLHVEHEDGGVRVHGTGPGWRWADSHVRAADLVEGQHEDLRLVENDWCTTGHDDAGWAPVGVEDRGYDGLVPSPAPPVRVVEQVRPVAVTAPRPGVFVVDLGQNVNGRVRLHDLGPAGTTTTLTHGEALGPDGDVTTDHLRPAVPFLPEPLSAGQVDSVVSAGRPGDVFDPRFTTHGFRYVRVEGRRVAPAPDDVTGLFVHSDLEPRGTFDCSDPRLVRLHEAVVRSLRGNACDVPTDCPHRERAAWTGDWQVFVPTATFLLDVAGFSVKWLRDVVSSQWDDGTVVNMAPMPRAEQDGFMARLNGSAGWGDAVVLVPWELYQEYGDTGVLADTWPAVRAWLDRARRMASTQRHPDRIAARPEPAAHEEWLWDSGFHWGEWLEPDGAPTDFPAFVAADKSDVANAYWARSCRLAARVAAVLGHAEEQAEYNAVADRVEDAWRREYLVDGRVQPRTQAALARALRFGLVPEPLVAQAVEDLVDLVRAAGNHVGTGFLSTGFLLQVLADHVRADVAYDVLLADGEPGWTVMLDRGATTVWERWNGIDADGVPHESLNHYSKGAVVGFLHSRLAGLRRTESTWRRFAVRPVPGGGVTWVRASHLTPHGEAAVHWRTGPAFDLTVTVPPGCVADVVLPDGSAHKVGPGTVTLTCPPPG